MYIYNPCSNYKGIAVTSVMSGLYGKILRDLIEEENKNEAEQSGFRTGQSCTDNIFCMKQVTEKRNATNQETHLLFADMTKAYDSIPISKLWEVLGESNINNTLIKALQNLYGNTAQVTNGTYYPTLSTLLKDYARDVAFPLHFLRFTYEKL